MSLEGVVGTASRSAGSPNVQDLDETGSQDENPESGGYFIKEFFWDKIVIFLTTSIIGLTVVDILTELLRGGSGVVCFLPDDLNFSEAQVDYVNSFCSQSVPDAQYLPIFVLIHGVLIAAWHYLWRSSFSTHFDYFFSLTNHLVRFRDDTTGEYPLKNLRIINRLETEFCTYRRSKILRWYQAKLFFQLITAIVSILLSFLLFNNFDVDFVCQWRDPGGIGIVQMDSNNPEIPCIFASLRLFSLVRIFDTILLGLIILVLLCAILWTILRHSDELGPKDAATFAYTTGISPEHYVPKSLTAKEGILRLFSPRIKTDFDFLVMALYKTDSGLAHIFKEGQIHQDIRRFIEAEIRYLTTYHLIEEVDSEEIEQEKRIQPKWIIPHNAKRTFQRVPISRPLQIPSDIAGAVMGFGLRAPSNKYALDVSFGSLGFSLALARVFILVGSLNFDPDYKNEDEPILPFKYPTNLTSFRCHPDIFSLRAELTNKFTEETHNRIWKKGYKAGFVVIGPVGSKAHLSTLTKLINRFDTYFVDGAILLTVLPKKIEGKKTNFYPFRPPKKLFELLPHSVKSVRGPLQWPPPDIQGTVKPTNSFSLECGKTFGEFELTAYEFKPADDTDSEPDVSSSEEEQSDSGDSISNKTSDKEAEESVASKKPGRKDSETVPLLTKGKSASSEHGLPMKVENPLANVKKLNTAADSGKTVEVGIEMEPPTESDS